jgi:hypothetical protein
VLAGETVLEGDPSIVALANGWNIINVGGAPTNDKPAVTLEASSDQDRVSAFRNIRVADMYEARGRDGVSDAADRPRPWGPLLHPRPGRPSHRGGTVDGSLEGRTPA